MSKKKFSIGFITLIAGVLYIVVIGFYLLKFFNFNLSNEMAQWGQLGDYIGGILNPAFSFFTLIIVISNYKEEQKRSSDIKTEMQKQEKEKNISSYIKYLEKCENDLDIQFAKTKPYFRPYNTIYATSNIRRSGGHPVFWDLTDKWLLMQKFNNKIFDLDPENPVLEYINDKYQDVRKELTELGYIK